MGFEAMNLPMAEFEFEEESSQASLLSFLPQLASILEVLKD